MKHIRLSNEIFMLKSFLKDRILAYRIKYFVI